MNNGRKHKKIKKSGFTLVEMLVAVFIFSIVMTIATGAVVLLVSSNKASQAIKSSLDNLNSTLDSMSRNIRYGTIYHCADVSESWSGGTVNDTNLNDSQSCNYDVNGDTAFNFLSKDTVTEIEYKYDPATKSIQK